MARRRTRRSCAGRPRPRSTACRRYRRSRSDLRRPFRRCRRRGRRSRQHRPARLGRCSFPRSRRRPTSPSVRRTRPRAKARQASRFEPMQCASDAPIRALAAARHTCCRSALGRTAPPSPGSRRRTLHASGSRAVPRAAYACTSLGRSQSRSADRSASLSESSTTGSSRSAVCIERTPRAIAARKTGKTRPGS